MARTTNKIARFAQKIRQLVGDTSPALTAASEVPMLDEMQLQEQLERDHLEPQFDQDMDTFHTQVQKATFLISLEEEARFINDCLRAVRVSKDNAEQVADALVAADYRGQFSHGLHLLRTYIANIKNKSIHTTSKPVILKQSLATAWVTGKNALGPVVGNYCMDLAVKKARQVGVGFVSVKESNNFGIASWYAMLAAKENFIGIAMSNDSPLMAAYNGISPVLGANPLACALPGETNTFVLDMATTTVPMEKFEYSLLHNRSIPPNWILDENGQPTCSPENAYTLAPFAGYKGYGLAGMIDILCGVLSGAHYSTKVRSWSSQNTREKANLGQAFIAIDPEVFKPGFDRRANDFTQILRLAKPIDVLKPVQVPGDIESDHMRQVDVAGGIHFNEEEMFLFNELAKQLGVKELETK